MPSHERRGSHRFPVQLPIVVAASTTSREIQGVVHNMSVHGLFFSTESWPRDLSQIAFKMMFPTYVTGTESARVRGQGTVLRVEDGSRSVGIAASIDSYEIG
jgi:PilZ domain-containing protein